MDYRTLELTLTSAKGLKKVNLIGKMDVYAVVTIYGSSAGGKGQTLRTPVDKDGDSNPTWNFPMKFTIDESAALQNRLTLVVKIKTEGVFGDKDLGEVHVPVKELLEGASSTQGKPMQFVTYQVRRPSGKAKGELSFSYKFGEKVAGKASNKADEPVTAYPAAAMAMGSSSAYPPPYAAAAAAAPGPYPPAGGAYYPPPPAGYPTQQPAGYAYQHQQQPGYAGYPPPPPPGYGGYPPQAGYGYPPVVQPQQPPKKNKFGMGLGAGLLGGALGGLLIGDIVSDANGGGCGGGGCGGGGCGGGCGGS